MTEVNMSPTTDEYGSFDQPSTADRYCNHTKGSVEALISHQHAQTPIRKRTISVPE